MPRLDVQARSFPPSPTFPVNAVSSSEAASLKGKKAKTPVIAGSVIGGLMGLAWIIGFTIYFIKRYKRKKLHRKIEAGKAVQKQKEPKAPEEKIIIPPDPAVLLGYRLPGESAFADEKLGKDAAHARSKTPPPRRSSAKTEAGNPDSSTSTPVSTKVSHAQPKWLSLLKFNNLGA